ncbi:MAG: hypothetical protein Q9170_000909 [Blastenia crenularia]
MIAVTNIGLTFIRQSNVSPGLRLDACGSPRLHAVQRAFRILSFHERPVIKSLRRKRSTTGDVEDMPPIISKDPRGANVRQPNPAAAANQGTTIQGKYFDGRSEFVGDRRRLHELTKYTVEPDQGTPYPCYARNLRSYQRRPRKNVKTPLSNEVATSKLVNFLNQDIVRGSPEHAAIHRLANGMQLEQWGPDLILKAFDDLDIVFFRGVMSTRTQIVYLTQQEIAQEWGRNSKIFGFCESLGYGRCRIVLNATSIFLHSPNPFAEMWLTMLHEMVVRSIQSKTPHGLTGESMVILMYSVTIVSPLGLIEKWVRTGLSVVTVNVSAESLRQSTSDFANFST